MGGINGAGGVAKVMVADGVRWCNGDEVSWSRQWIYPGTRLLYYLEHGCRHVCICFAQVSLAVPFPKHGINPDLSLCSHFVFPMTSEDSDFAVEQ